MSYSQGQMCALITAQALDWFVAHRAGPLSEAQREAIRAAGTHQPGIDGGIEARERRAQAP